MGASDHKTCRAVVRTGFTFVELLVVIAIIAVMLGIMFPAIQGARHAAHRVQCANNLHQIGLAFANYRDQNGYYPSAGWGWAWIGDPNHGTGRKQPGGWLYQILPFTEQKKLHDLGMGTPTAEAAIQLVNARVPIYNCPARRDGGPYPNLRSPKHFSDGIGGVYHFGEINFRSDTVTRADYAVNVGSKDHDEYTAGPLTLAEGLSPKWQHVNNFAKYNGVVFLLSQVRVTDITRGSSNVYLVGERYLDPAQYATGNDPSDNETMFSGFDNDNCRCTAAPPMRDKAGVTNSKVFGSAHRGGFNMCFGDGSVRFIAYDVDSEVHRLAGKRD